MARATSETLVDRLHALAKEPRTRLADVLPHLDSAEAEVREAALLALWDLPCEAALHVLLRCARQDPDLRVQAAAATTLGRYIWAGMQLDEMLDEQFGLSEGVSSAEVKIARTCLTSIQQDSARAEVVRHRALEALSYDPDDVTHAEIEALWSSGDEALRSVALRCMGRTGHPRWRAVLLEAVSDPRSPLLLAAIDAVGEGCVDAAEGRLLELLEHTDRPTMLAALWALRNVVHTTPARKAIERLGRSRDLEIKKVAKATLQEIDAIDVQERADDSDDD